MHKIMKKMNKVWLGISDLLDMQLSRAIDISTVDTVCLALGPYRNLTTLTASMLFLHPKSQVLNHAGNRIYGNSRLDFLDDFTRHKMDSFIRFAIQISKKGYRGKSGGSIIHSHAFDSGKVRSVYEKSGLGVVKSEIKCLFWKESLRTSKVIRRRNVDLGAIFEVEERLRFLLPIRNPLDCAVSSIRTGHATIFDGITKASPVSEVVKAILDEFYWFAGLQQRYPERFFCFTQDELSAETLDQLARFLKVEPAPDWIENTLAILDIKPGYKHDEALVGFCKTYIEGRRHEYPEFSERLLKLIA